MTTQTNTKPMELSKYIEMQQSTEFNALLDNSYKVGKAEGIGSFKRKIKKRIEYFKTSIRTKERTLKDTNLLCHKDILKGEIKLYKSKIEELQFLMGE